MNKANLTEGICKNIWPVVTSDHWLPLHNNDSMQAQLTWSWECAICSSWKKIFSSKPSCSSITFWKLNHRQEEKLTSSQLHLTGQSSDDKTRAWKSSSVPSTHLQRLKSENMNDWLGKGWWYLNKPQISIKLQISCYCFISYIGWSGY